MDERFLSTLPSQEIRSGVGEMLHYAALGDEELFSAFEAALVTNSEHLTPVDMTRLAMRVLMAKRQYIEADEFDTNVRKSLNFGHTFAHGIEFASEGIIPHGIAVAYGIDMANEYAKTLGILNSTTSRRIERLIRSLVDGSELTHVTAGGILEGMSRDKKRSSNRVNLILIKSLGKPVHVGINPDEQFRLFLSDYLAEW